MLLFNIAGLQYRYGILYLLEYYTCTVQYSRYLRSTIGRRFLGWYNVQYLIQVIRTTRYSLRCTPHEILNAKIHISILVPYTVPVLEYRYSSIQHINMYVPRYRTQRYCNTGLSRVRHTKGSFGKC